MIIMLTNKYADKRTFMNVGIVNDLHANIK